MKGLAVAGSKRQSCTIQTNNELEGLNVGNGKWKYESHRHNHKHLPDNPE